MGLDTLYVTDLDGTLLGSDGRLSQRTRAGLDALYDAGAAVSVATGRAQNTLSVLDGVRFRTPLILLGGARLYDLNLGRTLSEHTLPAALALEALKLLRQEGLSALVYTQNRADAQRIYYERGADDRLLEYVAMLRAQGDDRFRAVARHEERLHEKVFYITACAERDRLARPARQIAALGAHTQFYSGIRARGVCALEVCAVSKRVGVEELRALTGAQRVVAFGDNGNDLGLFEGANVRIAVENAVAALKDSADCVIGSNDEDAVILEMLRREGISLAD